MKKKKEETIKEKGGSLSDTLKDIRAKFGAESIMTLDQKPHSGVEAIATGSMGLDEALGIGGLPRGRVIEIYGPESCGKTTLSLHVVAEAQKKGGICAFIDAEHALDPQYAERLGVNLKELLISQPDGGEDALQIADALVRSGKIAVVVIDSVASLTPKVEINGEIGSISIGAQARLMSQALRMMTSSISKTKTLVIFINQIRMNVGNGGYGNPETTTGGKALKFYASVRIDLRKIATIKKGEEAMGSRVRAKVIKNKVAPPFRVTEFDILYNEGISTEGEILALGEKYGILKKPGVSYTYKDNSIGRGYDAARSFLKEHKDISKEIVDEILAEIKKSY